jgi:hypothetical protein
LLGKSAGGEENKLLSFLFILYLNSHFLSFSFSVFSSAQLVGEGELGHEDKQRRRREKKKQRRAAKRLKRAEAGQSEDGNGESAMEIINSSRNISNGAEADGVRYTKSRDFFSKLEVRTLFLFYCLGWRQIINVNMIYLLLTYCRTRAAMQRLWPQGPILGNPALL